MKGNSDLAITKQSRQLAFSCGESQGSSHDRSSGICGGRSGADLDNSLSISVPLVLYVHPPSEAGTAGPVEAAVLRNSV
jgi:hypothetical protein